MENCETMDKASQSTSNNMCQSIRFENFPGNQYCGIPLFDSPAFLWLVSSSPTERRPDMVNVATGRVNGLSLRMALAKPERWGLRVWNSWNTQAVGLEAWLGQLVLHYCELGPKQ